MTWHEMKTRWLQLATQLAMEETAAQTVWQKLASAYGADGRFYHNLNHIQHALDIAAQLKEAATDDTAVQLAIWFHDVVYDPRRSDNEAQSAAFARELLAPLNVSLPLLDAITDLILATQNHQTAVPNPNCFVLLDADLAIFCAAPPQYDAYARAIRQEYSFVSDEAYRLGRTAVLQRFLARTPFYFTEWMRERGETAVVQNITRELKQLEETE